MYLSCISQDHVSLRTTNFCWFHDDKFQNRVAFNCLALVNLIDVISCHLPTHTLGSSKFLDFESLNMSGHVIFLCLFTDSVVCQECLSPIITLGLLQTSLSFGRVLCRSPYF